MLRLRIGTALILAAVVTAAVFWLSATWLAAFFYLFVLVGGYEWAKLAGVGSRTGRIAYPLALAAAGIAWWHLPGQLWAVATFWCGALLVVVRFPQSSTVLRSKAAVLVAGGFALAGAWVALILLKQQSAYHVMWVLVATALADIAAYFAGRRFGRRQLAPAASPGKTWEGCIGGGLATLAWAACGSWFFDGILLAWLGAGVAIAGVAVVGDLFESVLKRSKEVKDSGAILPGHGGLLDRIDAALATCPVFALLTGWL